MIIRTLAPNELSKLSEIDVSEEVSLAYRWHNDTLESFSLQSARPQWNAADWATHLAEWQHNLQPDLWLGAFDNDRLGGAASLRYRLPGMPSARMAQLTTLHIDKAYRRQGVARQLFAEIKRLAKESGATSIYVSATESQSAVGFYLRQGFVPTDHPHPELFALEPEDIHMICQLTD